MQTQVVKVTAVVFLCLILHGLGKLFPYGLRRLIVPLSINGIVKYTYIHVHEGLSYEHVSISLAFVLLVHCRWRKLHGILLLKVRLKGMVYGTHNHYHSLAFCHGADLEK